MSDAIQWLKNVFSFEGIMRAFWPIPTVTKEDDEMTSEEDQEREPEGGWQPWDGPADRQPRNRKEILEVFGNPGKGTPDKKWARDNVVECSHRNGNPFPGQPNNRIVWVNKIVEPYLREALRRAAISAPEYVIETIACYVFRHTRHDPNLPLSMHSWAIAVDIDPKKNGAKNFQIGKGPKAYSDEYNKIWPDGLPEGFVRAFQSCGFAWGSDWDEDGISTDHTYYDPMHFEWVARDGKNVMV